MFNPVCVPIVKEVRPTKTYFYRQQQKIQITVFCISRRKNQYQEQNMKLTLLIYYQNKE